MKSLKSILIIVIVLISFPFSCNNSGVNRDIYLGTWKNKQNNQELIISIVGSNSYSLKLRVPNKDSKILIKNCPNADTIVTIGYSGLSYLNGNLCLNGNKFVTYSNCYVIFKDLKYEKVNIEDKKSNQIEEKKFDLRKLIGHWKTLIGDKELYFFNNGHGIEFLGSGYPFSGKFYPNMEPGTKTKIIIQGDKYIAWHTTSRGGGAGYYIKYFPDKDHILLNIDEYERVN